MNKKCLVTGGCGFIGSSLVRRLVNDGWSVDVVDDMSNGHIELLEGLKFRVVPIDLLRVFESSDIELSKDSVLIIEGDFSHNHILENIFHKKYDVIFHQAAVPRVLFSVENPSLTTNVNILGTVKLFESAIDNVERIVFASSSSVYGGSEDLPISELHKKDPKSPYAWQKSAIEDVSKLFGDLYDLDIVCLRYFNVFGPGQYGDSPYSTAVSAWCNNTKIDSPLRSDGDGTQSRDLCFISNIVDANILAAMSLRKGGFMGRCYNIACNDQIANNEILDFFKNKFSNVSVANAPWRQGDVMHTRANIDRAKEELGYEPKIKFWEGLNITLDWWDLNGDFQNNETC